jgi:hypothetical protein
MLLKVFLAALVIAVYALNGASILLASAKARADAQMARYENTASAFAEHTLTSELETVEHDAVTAGLPYTSVPALAAMAPTALCDTSAPCGFSATATYSVDGESDVATGTPSAATVVAPNVESASGVWERRVAVTMTVNIIETGTGAIVHTRPMRVKMRLWAPNNAEVEEDQDAAARDNRQSYGAAENEGCSATGTGCDPSAPSTPDPTTLDAESQCVVGAGSGTCAPGEMQSVQQKVNRSWNNGQAAGGTGP